MNPIKSDLAALRLPAADTDLNGLLSTIGNYSDYLLVLIDGKLATAPDDKDRQLAAVFTTEEERSRYLNELPHATKTEFKQRLKKTSSGRELFTQLATMPLDGIVFNCANPQQPIAFVPTLSTLVLQRLALEAAGSVEPAPATPPPPPVSTASITAALRTVAHDFVALTKAALPNLQPGSRAAVNALWRATFLLDQWLFIMHPSAEVDPRPFVDKEAGYVCLFGFTDGDQLHRFAKENGMLDAKGNALMLSISPENVIAWGRQEHETGGSQRIHFNFGGPGWFAPLAGLPGIYEFVQNSSE